MSDADDPRRAAASETAMTAQAKAPMSRGRRAALWIGAPLALIALVAALAVAAIVWSLHHPAGSAWLLGRVPGLTIVDPEGSLIGDFAATRVVYAIGDAGELRLEALRWHGLAASRGDGGRWLHLVIDSVHADSVLWVARRTDAPAPATTPLPQSLRLPLEIEVREARIDALRIGSAEAEPVRDVRARVHLGADGGARHRFDSLAAAIERGVAHGAAAIGADAPFPVEASLDAATAGTDPAWSAALHATGPLASLATSATVRVAATSTHAAQSLDANAVLHPLARWPLGELHASARSLDLGALASALPATSLSGDAVVTTSGVDAPASVSVALVNDRAGRWNEGLLPIRRVRAELRARPEDASVVEVQELAAELGSAGVVAGSISGRGRWSGAAWNVDATLRDVRPAALDARAAEAVVSGTASLVGSDFAAAAPSASAPASGSASARAARVDVKADLTGQLTDRRLSRAAARPARLRIDARASADEIELRSAEASLAEATAKLDGRLVRKGAADPWRVTGRLALARFDPAPWWPGAPDSLLGRGANRLNANGDFDLVIAPSRSGESAYATLAATAGRANVAVVDSILAGVALRGTATFANPDGRARIGIDVNAAGNGAQVQGTVAPRGASDDDWRIAIDAPQLASLASLLAPPTTDPRQRGAPALAGRLVARGHVAGRWPDVSSDGAVQATALRVETVTVGQASGRWRVGSSADAALDAALVLDSVDVGGRALERVQAQLAGTARNHRLDVRIASALLPPQWTDALAVGAATANESGAHGTANAVSSATTAPSAAASPPPPPTASRAASLAPAPAASMPRANAPAHARSIVSVSAEGGLVDVAGQRAGGWRGTVREALARSLAVPERTWLSARDVHTVVLWSGGALRVEVDPGKADVLGATLRWKRVAWQQGDARAPAHLDAQAEVDAIAIAPILQAMQPDFGWGGDLRVGAHLNVRSSGSVVVDAVIERTSGDLAVTDEISTRRLGLSDLRLGVAAEGGVWHFTAAAAGGTLGVASAAVTARTSASATWPGPETPLAGVSELRVDDLGTWGAWLAPGWRLGGRLHASASFGGRFGAPQYTGHVEGTGVAVRNFLEGVDISDGQIAIALRGTTAHIDSFTAKGGAGTLRLAGDAAFDAAPTAQLRLDLDRFQVLGRVDRRIVATGSGALRLGAGSIALGGNFKVDEGLIDFTRSDAPTLGSDVEVVRRPGEPAPATAVAREARTPVAVPAQRALRLDVRVDMGERLRVRGRGLDAGLRGELHLTSPGGRLAVDGTLRTVDGTYQAYGQNLGIDRGILIFVGPVENPRLDIEATRPNLDVRVGVTVTGTALNPRIRLFSDPELSDLDKLSWLVLGRASASTGGADTALLQEAAVALLSGEGPGVTDRIIKSIGLDEISVRQSQGAVKDTIVSVGKQISKRWYVGYEQGLNSTLGTWQLIYRVAQRITVRAEAGSDNALDVIWTWRWK